MSLVRLVVRQALGLAQAVGFYPLVAFGAPLVAMVVMAFVGYVPYSDRPGPGWYGLRLGVTAREIQFFVGWWAFTGLYAMPVGALLFALQGVLRIIRVPRRLVATICGLAGFLLSAYLAAATGWYIAISAVPVVVAAVAGSLYGALVLPRLPIAIASASGRLSVSRLAVAGAIPVAVVAVVALMLAEPRARAEPQQAAALVIIGCSLDHAELSPSSGALTDRERGELRRLGVVGPVGVVAIITPWTASRGAGGMQQLPIGETGDGQPREQTRTVIVTPRLPDAPLELYVAFPSPGLYLKRDQGWTTIPAELKATRRVRLAPITDAPGNVHVELADVALGSSFRYCR
jgi:hypothetical protein